MPGDAIRLARWCLAAAALLLAAGCGDSTGPACTGSCDASLVVYGRVVIGWSGTGVAGATATVQLYGDTTRTVIGDCAGTTPLATATAPMDTAGNYRLPLVVPGAASRWVCVEVTGDPHFVFSDVGLNHVSAGVIQLRAAPDATPPDSVRVDFHYSELS